MYVVGVVDVVSVVGVVPEEETPRHRQSEEGILGTQRELDSCWIQLRIRTAPEEDCIVATICRETVEDV